MKEGERETKGGRERRGKKMGVIKGEIEERRKIGKGKNRECERKTERNKDGERRKESVKIGRERG